ncbi:MAG: DUF4145 domain-containing protein, partial [Caldilinea sp.]
MLLATNFKFLETHDEQLVRLGMLAERYFPDDPNTCILKLRQYGEVLAQLTALQIGEHAAAEGAQFELLRRLQNRGILPREVFQLFHEVRRAGNAASHELHSSYMTALSALKMSWQLGLWSHRTFAEPAYSPAPFVPPPVPKHAGAEVRAELERLAAVYTATHARLAETPLPAHIGEDDLPPASDDQAYWEQIAADAETAGQALYEHLAAQQSESAGAEPIEVTGYVAAANAAAAL